MIQRLKWLNYEVCYSYNEVWKIIIFSSVVRVIMELVSAERSYENLHMESLGPVDVAFRNTSNDSCYSESYEVHALCNMLECNIRSFCPSVGLNPTHLAMLNKVFTPMPPRNVNCNITILWSNAEMEMDAKATNRGNWSPNHFVPLLSTVGNGASNDGLVLPPKPVQLFHELMR